MSKLFNAKLQYAATAAFDEETPQASKKGPRQKYKNKPQFRPTGFRQK